MSTFEKLQSFVSDLWIVDTHEHLPDHAAKRERPTDVLREYLIHYFDKDLISAGMPRQLLEDVRDIKKPLPDRWRLVEPYWRLASNTGYGRALRATANGLYGIDRIDAGSIGALNEAFQKSLDDPNWFHHVLHERSRIAISILDGWVDYNREPRWDKLFAPVQRIDGLVTVTKPASAVARMEERHNLHVRSFQDYLDLIDAEITLSVRLGYVGFKLGLAYQRTLSFARSSHAEAGAAFAELAAGFRERIWRGDAPDAPKVLQDYCLHHCLRAIEKAGLPLQIHTGLQEGNGNIWLNSDPMLLYNLFIQYPDLRFDLFHIGYPDYLAVAALAKNFPNVFIDMCWAHIISPQASVQAIMEYVDSVPANKVSAFGGDYCMIDTVYGHQLMARQNVSRALASKVDQGDIDLDQAYYLAKRMLVDNPADLFKLTISDAGSPAGTETTHRVHAPQEGN
jgi:hypothetical protein